MAYGEKNLKMNEYMYMHNWLILLYIINQLDFNKDTFLKFIL